MALPNDVIAADRALSGGEQREGIARVMSIRNAARYLGLSPTTVLRQRQLEEHYRTAEDGTILIRRTIGLDGKHRPNRRFDTTARDARIRSMREDGQSIRAIATAVNCSVGTVHRVLRTGP